jgi:anion-transporting  ArsA/GET3 family ATPase
LIVAGKGGVGKTTVAATLARMASRAGVNTLVVEVEGRSGVAPALGHTGPLDYREAVLVGADPAAGRGAIRGRTITPDDALLEYLDEHGMRRISRRLVKTGAVEVVATAIPGIKDILVLGKIKQVERLTRPGHADDLIILDAPAAGHAVTFLHSAYGLLDAVRVGPVRSQAQEVVDLLRDPRRCQVLLVTLPEETPVNELVETAYSLEDRVGVRLAPVVVNGMYPVLDGLEGDPTDAARASGIDLDEAGTTALRDAAAFRRQRQTLQAEQVRRLNDALPLPQLRLPYLFTETIGPAEIDALADALAADVRRLPERATVG